MDGCREAGDQPWAGVRGWLRLWNDGRVQSLADIVLDNENHQEHGVIEMCLLGERSKMPGTHLSPNRSSRTYCVKITEYTV